MKKLMPKALHIRIERLKWFLTETQKLYSGSMLRASARVEIPVGLSHVAVNRPCYTFGISPVNLNAETVS